MEACYIWFPRNGRMVREEMGGAAVQLVAVPSKMGALAQERLGIISNSWWNSNYWILYILEVPTLQIFELFSQLHIIRLRRSAFAVPYIVLCAPQPAIGFNVFFCHVKDCQCRSCMAFIGHEKNHFDWWWNKLTGHAHNGAKHFFKHLYDSETHL